MSEPNIVTLNRFILVQEHLSFQKRLELANLLSGIQLACKIVSNAIRRAGMEHLYGLAGSVNVQGEDVTVLDNLANAAWVSSLTATEEVCVMVSEEETEALIVDEKFRGRYVVTFDPLDGSSNIDANVSIGSIFGIFEKTDDAPPSKLDALRSAKQFTAAGYAIYGSATLLVFSTGATVDGFTLDNAIGEFVLTHPNMRIPLENPIYSINEGNSCFWDKGTTSYINRIKKAPKPYSSRYIGSMVADVHRTLLYGGIFAYPGDSRTPSGKLRYLYEVGPLAFLCVRAGGGSTDGRKPSIEFVPTLIHQRVPVFMGSAVSIQQINEAFAQADA